MQNEIPFSLIVWDNVDILPFPDEVKQIIKAINWEEYEWHAAGLPIPFAKYSVSGGKTLYLSELPDGSTKVEKEEFTGNIMMAGFFVDEENPDGTNFFVNFLVTFLKGCIVEVNLSKVSRQSTKDYLQAIKDFNENVRKVIKISSSWWFKWLYRPWFYVVRGLGYLSIAFLNLIRALIVWSVTHLTPL